MTTSSDLARMWAEMPPEAQAEFLRVFGSDEDQAENQRRRFEEEPGIGVLNDGTLNIVGGVAAGRSPRVVLPALEGSEADIGDLEDYEEFETGLITKDHLPGEHDQKTHGHEGGGGDAPSAGDRRPIRFISSKASGDGSEVEAALDAMIAGKVTREQFMDHMGAPKDADSILCSLMPDGRIRFQFHKGYPADPKGDGTGITCARIFDPGRKVVEHELLLIGKKEQGHGKSKKLLAGQVALYQKLGFAHVTTEANVDRGAYAWAKYGFKPTKTSWTEGMSELGSGPLREELADRMKSILRKDYSPEAYAVETMLKLTKGDDPRLVWAISDVDNKYTKDIFKDLSWYGVLDLGDKQSMERFNGYIAKAKG